MKNHPTPPQAGASVAACGQINHQSKGVMTMKAKRTEPRVHCYRRAIAGDYVPAAGTTSAHLAAVFAAERARLAAEAKPKRGRKPRAPVAVPDQGELRLVHAA